MSKLLVLAVTPSRKSSELSTAELATAGFLSAIPTTLVTAPVERAKVLLQVCDPAFLHSRDIEVLRRFKAKRKVESNIRV